MELTDANVITLTEHLRKTLNPDVEIRRPAEKFLISLEINKNYPILLLHLVSKDEIDITTRVAGAVGFKNYVKRNWQVVEGCPDRIHEEDRQTIKTLIVDLMLKAPESIQKQLSDAVSTIGSHDFPVKWPGLMDQMVEKFSSGDFHMINGVLHTAHSLFKKYRHELKSQSLWEEIKFVLDKFAQPLTQLFEATMGLLKQVQDVQGLSVVCSSLTIICKVFYSLNSQDLPEFFEDNMPTWMTHFLTLLSLDLAQLHTAEEDQAGLLERLKGQICDNIALYAQKYDEEFRPYLPNFVTAVWSLLVTTGKQTKYDSLVSYALSFLSHVAERSYNRELFQDPTTLKEICEKVVIPNMEFRASDEELFEDNAEEYIRRDIEGSDVDTRRRSACDFVKALSNHFEENMMGIFGQYVAEMLKQYSVNPAENWKCKDAACYLVTSLVTRGKTEKHGVTQTSQLVNLSEFATTHVITQLQNSDINTLPVLKADTIKFIMVFRSVLPPQLVKNCLPLLVRHLPASSAVVHTYCAAAIDKILLLRNSDNTPLVRSEDLSPLAEELLKNLFGVLEQQVSQDNEYVMKAIMRSFSTLQASVVPYLGILLPKLTEKLALVARNPSKPHFNHFLFETVGLSIKIVCKDNPEAVTSFEQVLFPTFHVILQQDVQEFIPYVFQILSLLLELQPTTNGTIPEAYMSLLPCLLAPVLWERPGNIRPLVRLLQAAIVLGPQQIIQDNRLTGLLGVFQKLIASKVHDHEGFYLMQHMLQHLPEDSLKPYIKQIFVLVFTRLQSSKTGKFLKSIIVFFCFFATRFGANELVNMIDSIQPNLFGMLIERVYLMDVQKISSPVDKKITAIGLVKLLSEANGLVDGVYTQFWIPLLKALIGLFELPEDTSTHPDDTFIDIEDTPDYTPAYIQLACARGDHYDPLSEVTDARMFLAHSLGKLSTATPGRLVPLINTLTEEERNHLSRYFTSASVNIS